MMNFKIFNNDNTNFRKNCIYINRNGNNTNAYNSNEQSDCNFTDLIEIEILDTDKIYPGFLYYLILWKKDIVDQYRVGTTVNHITIPNLKKALKEIMQGKSTLEL